MNNLNILSSIALLAMGTAVLADRSGLFEPKKPFDDSLFDPTDKCFESTPLQPITAIAFTLITGITLLNTFSNDLKRQEKGLCLEDLFNQSEKSTEQLPSNALETRQVALKNLMRDFSENINKAVINTTGTQQVILIIDNGIDKFVFKVPYNALGKDSQGKNFNSHTINDALKEKTMFGLLSVLLQTQLDYKVDMQPCVEMIPTQEYIIFDENFDPKILDANIQCIQQGFVVLDGASRANWGIDRQNGDKLVLIDTGEVYNLEELFNESTPNNGDKKDRLLSKKNALHVLISPATPIQLLLLFPLIDQLSENNRKTLVNIMVSKKSCFDNLNGIIQRDNDTLNTLSALSKNEYFLETSTIFDANPPPPTTPHDNERCAISCNIFKSCY